MVIHLLSISPLPCPQLLLQVCFCGEETLTPELLIESFKSYMSQDESKVLEKALGNDFDPKDEDLLDLLSYFKCYKNEKKPTAKSVINLLSTNPTSEAEQNSLEDFKRFVQSLNGSDLGGLLQFLTGSNIILCKTITVTFTTLEGKSRRPIVHTCGPSLELPST